MPEININSSIAGAQTKRQIYDVLRGQMELEQQSFRPHWQDISDYLLPRRLRFYTHDVNRGDRRNTKIIDSSGTLAHRTLRAGMMSGVTSTARPWFRVTTADQDLAEYQPVKVWLDQVTKRLATMFLRSNLYNSLPVVYGDMGGFGTGAMFIDEDFEDGIRTYPLAVGSYFIANDNKLKVQVFYRKFRYTVRQIVMEFGQRDGKTGRPMWENFSSVVKNLWERSQYETWIDVCHIIKPNPEYDDKKFDPKYKKFLACYFEDGTGQGGQRTNYMADQMDRFLRETGHDYFPVLAPRWEVTGEDVYGTSCPGMDALGDIKQLQKEQKDKAQAIEKMHKPPMIAPVSMKNARSSILPGDITYTDEREGMKGFRPAMEVSLDIDHLRQDIGEIRQIISRAFYEDLFLMLAQSDRRQITAREIDERHEEKLVGIGPVLEQINQDLLDPLIDIGYYVGNAQRMFPPPPPEIQGHQLKTEYESIMHQAQKMVGIAGVERFGGFVGNLVKATGDPKIARRVDFDEMIKDYGDRTGINPKIIISDEKMEELAEADKKAAQAQQTLTALEQAGGVAKDLAGAHKDLQPAGTPA